MHLTVHVSQSPLITTYSRLNRVSNDNNKSLGFAFGPLCWAPISELWGRRMSLLPPMLAVGLFSIGTATSKNIQSLLITRYFGGLFASSPVSNVGAIMGDIWLPKVRGTAVVFYALCVVGGPTLVCNDLHLPRLLGEYQLTNF